jgi:hypothetical protein
MAAFAARAEEPIAIELNKVEQREGACRAYLLFKNPNESHFPTFRLDLVLFGKDGVIARRIAVDASPLRAGKSVVKLFDLTGLDCQTLARILLNDVSPCEDDGGARTDCVDRVVVSSRTSVDFFK